MVKNRCENCGKFYSTYAIILCDNPLCFASFLADEQKDDGSFRTICESCRSNLKDNKEFDEKFKRAMHKACLDMIGSDHDHIKI